MCYVVNMLYSVISLQSQHRRPIIYHAPTKHRPKLGSKTLIVHPNERGARQHYADPVSDPVLVYGIGLGQSEESGTKRRTYLVQRSSKAGRILAPPASECSPLPKLVRLLCAHSTGFVERPTNYEAHNSVTP